MNGALSVKLTRTSNPSVYLFRLLSSLAGMHHKLSRALQSECVTSRMGRENLNSLAQVAELNQ
jgi:hypothetical protein